MRLAHPPLPSLRPTHRRPLSGSAWVGWGLTVAALGAALTGCAGLPEQVDRPVSTALADPSPTPLAQWAQTQRSADKARHPSGFVLLSGPQAAYGSRLALVDAAQQTLDLQYYAIHADASTERLMLAVVAAAQRGVRVRVLLDDFHSTGRDAQVMRLAFVPNIEMRMFNPLTGARNSQLGRMFSLLGDFSRVQQRMHNKLFIADNAMGIAGGRNLGNAYFGNDESGNFVDLDVLATGPVVQALSRSFDAYWNNPRSYPVQSLISRPELLRMRESLNMPSRPATPNGPRPQPLGEPGSGNPTTAATADGQQPASAQRTRIWNQQPLDLRQMRWTWAPAAVLVDQPTKIPADSTEPSPPAAPQTAMPSPTPSTGATPATATASKAATPPADTVVDGLLQLMGQATQELLIVSPYFVPGADMKQAFASAIARGVRVRVLTNSLASNDAPLAHAGYARHRTDLLQAGVQLYEMRSELSGLRSMFLGTGSSGAAGGNSGSAGVGNSRAMLHSKLLVLDGRLLAVGSMNLDLRSQLQNTEIALLIQSRTLAAQATRQIEAALSDAAWRVELDAQGQLAWRAPAHSGLQDTTTEPDASAPLRWLLHLIGPLAPDHLL
ncbi:phospholipase D-like protein [Acidovorax sp. 56]|uniref:phospholipase D family protein n=1 Tax=Acidovorax sp. 56 TaxID=2035205 RepID=UPI000C16CF33|nr:phospholipase D family protein [Acidovorax sp. 56]PIF27050.1 phospholipase D-like protein [Acidovorax sp. 56]